MPSEQTSWVSSPSPVAIDNINTITTQTNPFYIMRVNEMEVTRLTTHRNLSLATTGVTPMISHGPPAEVIDTSGPLRHPVGRSSAPRKNNRIPTGSRPPNAFVLFRSWCIENRYVSASVETNPIVLSKIIGLVWNNMSDDAREAWHVRAKAALGDQRQISFKFRSVHARGKNRTEKRRRKRGTGANIDAMRCAKIAELLVEGKKGKELEANIHEFDLTHVPEVVIRFEAPLTAQMYSQSSSAAAARAETQSSPSPDLQYTSTTVNTPMSRNTTPSPSSRELSNPPNLCPTNHCGRSLTAHIAQPTQYPLPQEAERSWVSTHIFP